MNKSKGKCLSARKLPDTHIKNNQPTNPALNIKSLSLSFYNSNTKKCKKQILYDWESFIQPSHQEQQQQVRDEIVQKLQRGKGKNKSMSLKRQQGSTNKKDIRIRKSPSKQKQKERQTQRQIERQKQRDREREKQRERQRQIERQMFIHTAPLTKFVKSGNFHIKNLVIQNYYNSPYCPTQQKSIGILRNKSQIKSVKQKKIDLEKQTIERLREYLRKN